LETPVRAPLPGFRRRIRAGEAALLYEITRPRRIEVQQRRARRHDIAGAFTESPRPRRHRYG
jgi:hypothetical protein